LFAGHHQPHLPSDLGFYDLRIREVRLEQERLAKHYGIDGFCYYYYWFSGKRLLERPLDDKLNDGKADMPFCLCWCNENWTRRWNGDEQDVLMAQHYDPEDAMAFIDDLHPYITDPRYLKVGDKPLILVYRPQLIPDVRQVLGVWRSRCRELGVGEIHLCAALTHGNLEFSEFGFDSGVEFPPHNRQYTGAYCVNSQINYYEPFLGCSFLYHELAGSYLEMDYGGSLVFRGVFPTWDNTARSGSRAVMVVNGTPENYEYWLAESIKRTARDSNSGEGFVFINAWNEWAEGCHLEPDQANGRRFLEATQRAKNGQSVLSGFTDSALPGDSRKRLFVSALGKLIQHHFFLLLRKNHDRLKVFLYRNPRIKKLLKKLFFWV